MPGETKIDQNYTETEEEPEGEYAGEFGDQEDDDGDAADVAGGVDDEEADGASSEDDGDPDFLEEEAQDDRAGYADD